MTQPPTPLRLIAHVVDALDDHGVSYCHWKSNTAIARSETGENDLDLLVDRGDAAVFRKVLSASGFSRVQQQGKPQPPAKEDYFGYDAESGRLVHVDAHYQLVLGHDRTKNYRLPLEKLFLDTAEKRGLFPLPPPELEYIVFLTRMVLKYAIWDEVIWQGMRGRRAGLKRSEIEEFEDLDARVDPNLVHGMVRDHAPWLDGLLESAVSISRGELSLLKRLRTGRRVHRRLAEHARRSEIADAPLRLFRRIAVAWRRRFGSLPGFNLANGGAIIALIGGDGSGKSTAVAEISTWLGHEFEIRPIHLGKPRWSATTFAVRGGLKVIKLAHNALPKRSTGTMTATEADPSYREIAWLTCTARDRYLAYRKARRFADRGGLVISDRYPHPELQSMDVPLIGSLETQPPEGRLSSALEKLERQYHQQIEPPEILIVLRIDPESAANRKTDEPSDYVRRRVAEVWGIDWESTSVPVIDARRPKEEVAAEIKALIWDSLA